MSISMEHQTSTQKFYDHIAYSYEEISQSRRSYIEAVDDAIIGLREHKRSSSMLDIGSGNGLRAKKLSEAIGVKKLYLSDVSDKMLDHCQINVPKSKIVDLKTCTPASIGEKFDVITLQWNVLGHVESFEQRVNLLKECKKCLRPGGQIFLDVNNRHNSRYGNLRVLMRWGLDCIHPNYKRGDTMISANINNKSVQGFGHLFTLAELKDTIKKSGLKVTSLSFIDYDHGLIKKYFFQGQIFCAIEIEENCSV